jgi:hypothetical protein
MRYMGMFFVMTAMVVMAADLASGTTHPAPLMLVGNTVATAGKHAPPPPPPPPPPRSKRCPCDSQGNPIDKNCGKGNDSNNP